MIDFLFCLSSEKIILNCCLRDLWNWLELKSFLTCVSVICSSSASLCLSLEPRYFCRSNTRSNCNTCSTEKDERLLLDRDWEGPWPATSKQGKHYKFRLKLYQCGAARENVTRVHPSISRGSERFWQHGRFSSNFRSKYLFFFFFMQTFLLNAQSDNFSDFSNIVSGLKF